MDQHPIPQDVTGFQFKLIGTMTVKQFGYVAVGIVMGFVLFYVPASGFWLIVKWLLIPSFGIGGLVIAFVPIEGRPVDVMAKNFFRAIFSPNQYAYKRAGRKMSFSNIADARVAATIAQQQAADQAAKEKRAAPSAQTAKHAQLEALLFNTSTVHQTSIDKKESDFLNSVTTKAAPVQATVVPISPMASSGIPVSQEKVNAVLPTLKPPTHSTGSGSTTHSTSPTSPTSPITPTPPTVLPPTAPAASLSNGSGAADVPALQKEDDVLIKQEDLLESQLEKAKQQAAKNPPTDDSHKKVTELETQIKEVHQQKQELEDEIAKLKEQLSAHQTATPSTQPTSPTSPITPTPPTVLPPTARQDAAHVRSVPQNITKGVGLPHVSDTPNVVVGIVKDARGNVIPNILIEVKDKEENPVRAFKTNALGQFASATALPAGTYTIILEDPKKLHTFDVVQIIADNQIMMPIEIISHDAREDLRKQLFN